MAKSKEGQSGRDAGMNPFYMMLGLGAGTALIIALVIAATEGGGGDVVTSGPETETVDLNETVDEAEATTEEVAEEQMVEETDDAEEVIAPGRNDGNDLAEEGEALNENPDTDVEVAAPREVEEGSNGDAAEPLPADPVTETSGNAVSPEDTDGVVTPTGEGAAPAPDVDTPMEGDDAVEDTMTLETDEIIDDPDNGGGDGVEPDGGAGEFFPTPSGPEGSDGDPLTTE